MTTIRHRRAPRSADAAAAALRWLDARARAVAIAAIVLSVLVTGAYAVLLGNDLRFLDEQVYVDLTRSLATGHGYSLDGVEPTAYRPPGYAFLLLPMYLVSSGNVLAMRFVGVASLAGCVWLAYRLGRRAQRPATGALAAMGTACYPLLVYTADALYPQVPALFLLLLTLDLLESSITVSTTRRRVVLAAVAGIAAGLLVLSVPTFAVAVLLVAGWALLRCRRVAVVPVLIALVVTGLIGGAWTVRNAVVFGALVPVATNTGVNLLLGNSEGVTAGSGRTADISVYENEAARLHLTEVGQDEFYRRAALDWVRAHPGDAAVLYAQKVVNTFSHRNELATTQQSGGAQDLVAAVTTYPVLLLALGGALVAAVRRRLEPHLALLALLVVVNVLLLAAFFTRLRFRVPLDGLCLVLAAATVVTVLAALAGPVPDQRSAGPPST